MVTAIENAFSLLNASKPGEFYINRATAKIYYVAHPSEDMLKTEVVMP